jgi:hypothetical protein
MVGKSKNRRRSAERFKNIPKLLRLLINVNRNAAVQRKETEIATFLPIAARQLYLLSYWLMAVFGHFPAAFQYPLRIALRLYNSLWAFPSGFSIP